MNYYKMFNNDNCLGIINSNNFKFWNSNTQQSIIVPEAQANCIQYIGNFYCTISMPVQQINNTPYRFVELISATKNEYDEYNALLENDQHIEIPYPRQPVQPIIQPVQDQSQIQSKMTIQEMRDKITAQEQQINMLVECILEMSEQVYNE